MNFRLLIDLEIIEQLQEFRPRVRRMLLAHFHEIRSSPNQLSDYRETDSEGRRVEISVHAGYAIHYWIDHTDRHIKILAIHPADS